MQLALSYTSFRLTFWLEIRYHTQEEIAVTTEVVSSYKSTRWVSAPDKPFFTTAVLGVANDKVLGLKLRTPILTTLPT